MDQHEAYQYVCKSRADFRVSRIPAKGTLADVQHSHARTAATSSYVHVQPPPFSSLTTPSYGLPPSDGGVTRFLYSAGGPTGEVHAIDPESGALLSAPLTQTDEHRPLQEFVFLRDASPAALAKADKTRKALRYGAHSVDVGRGGVAYVADLGRDAILLYDVVGFESAGASIGRGDPANEEKEPGTFELVGEVPAVRAGDGPRHVVPSPDGRWAFSVTEHTSYVDVWAVDWPAIEQVRRDPSQADDALLGKTLRHVQSLGLLPAGADRHDYRGDTVRLSPDGASVLASTRGKTSKTKGIVRAWKLRAAAAAQEADAPVQEEPLFTYETPTSGGKANAIEFARRFGGAQGAQAAAAASTASISDTADLAVLTDDEQGYVLVLEWDGEQLVEKARTKLPGKGWKQLGEGEEEGASHAVWLS